MTRKAKESYTDLEFIDDITSPLRQARGIVTTAAMIDDRGDAWFVFPALHGAAALIDTAFEALDRWEAEVRTPRAQVERKARDDQRQAEMNKPMAKDVARDIIARVKAATKRGKPAKAKTKRRQK